MSATVMKVAKKVVTKAPAKPTLKRAIQRMPASVSGILKKHKLEQAYAARPPYQRNDYLGWIARAKLEATRQKRLAQMIDELKRGDVYMNMAWRGKAA
jgi:uncharacterized protein YdeI (YjbR/CyaY-like superfamily)